MTESVVLKTIRLIFATANDDTKRKVAEEFRTLAAGFRRFPEFAETERLVEEEFHRHGI